ncbi:MAG: hypothetical protein MUC38_10935 [Cyclobacteriaceae bacterium]|jgi:hypothetical protein|nr:hypothetical protein [Cyclobacteriaceae bacterium]
MERRSNTLILAFSDLTSDARVLRQINWVATITRVSVLCYNGPDKQFNIIPIGRFSRSFQQRVRSAILLLMGKNESAYQILYDKERLLKLTQGRTWDVVVANDIETLPLAISLRPARIIFDAHEYAPRHFEDKFWWRLFFQRFNHYLCQTYIPKVDAMATVGERIAEEYQKNFGKQPVVITNAPSYHGLHPSPVQPHRIRLVHHGGANWSRQLEIMMDVIALLDERFTLDMFLLSPPNANRKTKSYLEFLKRRAKEIGRIQILPPVAPNEIVAKINEYDMGIFLIPPVNFNYANTLPNKFFDFIQARLGVAIGPTPEMADITKKHQIGIVSDDFSAASLANKLRGLDKEQIENFKRNSDDLSGLLNAEENKKRFLGLFNENT